MKFRRSAAVLAAVTLATTGLAGCGKSGGGSATNLQLANDKVPFKPGYQAMSDALSKSQQLSLKINTYSDPATYSTAIRTGGAAHVQPPLFTWFTGSQMQQLVDAHQVADTSSVWDTAVQSGDLPAFVKPYYTYSGHQYCVPETVDYWGMYYNKTIFAKYNLSPPTTWSQLLNVAATLKAHGQTPFYEVTSTFAFVWFQILLGQSDPSAYNDLVSGKISFTSPPVVAAMNQWKELIDKGYMSDPTVQTDQQTQLATKKVAMVPSGTWLNSAFPQVGLPASDYGFFMIPNVNPSLAKPVTFFETSPLCAGPGTSKAAANASKVLSWWVSQPAQTVWSQKQQDISANPKVAAPIADFATLSRAVQQGNLQVLERFYEAVPAAVLQEALNDFSAFEVNTSSLTSQLQKIQKVNASSRSGQ